MAEQPAPKTLFNRAYTSLLATQFFGAANDNILKQVLTFMVATGIWSGRFGWNGLGEGGQVVPALCLTLPFILLSGYAGQISDKYSKQAVMYWVKVAEIPIAILGFIGFFTHNLWLTIGAMLLLAIQSSFYGPAKYGVLPEITRDEDLSMANGVINMLTNLAVIAGSFLAGPISDAFHPQPPPIPRLFLDAGETAEDLEPFYEFVVVKPDNTAKLGSYMIPTDENAPATGNFFDLINQANPQPNELKLASATIDLDGDGERETLTFGQQQKIMTNEDEHLGDVTVSDDGAYTFTAAAGYDDLAGTPIPWAPGVGLVIVAILGFLSMVPFPKVAAANPDMKMDWDPFKTYYESLAVMSKGPLLAVVMAWAAFYMIAMIALLILPEYQSILKISFTETSYLLGILGIGIGLGSVVTGWLSGNQIRPWLIPVGAGGMCVCFLLLGLVPPKFLFVLLLILSAGFFAGFYIVPLQALIQLLSPDDERGRIIGTAGAISFCFSSLGPVVFWVATNRMGMAPNRVFLICAAMAIVGTISV